MRISVFVALAVALVCAISPAPTGAVEYRTTFLAADASVGSINNMNQIIGATGLYTFVTNPNAFLTAVTPIRSGYDINDHGHAILSGPGTHYIASFWDGIGEPQPLTTLGGDTCQAEAINNYDQIAGMSQTSDGYRRACIWDPVTGIMSIHDGPRSSYAYGINDPGQVVGQYYEDNGGSQAFIWDPDTGMRDLPSLGGPTSIARDINNSGVAVGSSSDSAKTYATLWEKDGSPVNLGMLDGGQSSAYSINANGVVVGSIRNKYNFRTRPFVWDRAGGMRLLPIPLDYVEAVAYGINDAGMVVGSAIKGPSGQLRHDVILWTPVPEPSSMVVVALGIAGLAIRRRR